jgi:hypothetical protein
MTLTLQRVEVCLPYPVPRSLRVSEPPKLHLLNLLTEQRFLGSKQRVNPHPLRVDKQAESLEGIKLLANEENLCSLPYRHADTHHQREPYPAQRRRRHHCH